MSNCTAFLLSSSPRRISLFSFTMCYNTCKSHAPVSPLSIIVGASSATRIIAELGSIPKEDLTVVIAEQTNQSGQPQDISLEADAQNREKDDKSRRRPPIGELLRDLRGTKTLRQVEADTGITNAYLSNIELGLKKPGVKTLAKLGIYYQVPLDHLLNVAGLRDQTPEPAQQESVFDLRRGLRIRARRPKRVQLPKTSGYAAPGHAEIRRRDVPALHGEETPVGAGRKNYAVDNLKKGSTLPPGVRPVPRRQLFFANSGRGHD